jgi:hypothetical protein
MSQQLSVLSLIRRSAFFLFIFACLGGASVAQNVTLTGEVTDPSNSAVVNAEATLTNNSSHTVRHATTNQTGFYTFASVLPGAYTLTLEANNFTRYENTDVTVGPQNLTVNAKLELSSVSQSVTVRDDHQSLQEVSTLDKTGTKLEDLRSVFKSSPKRFLQSRAPRCSARDSPMPAV